MMLPVDEVLEFLCSGWFCSRTGCFYVMVFEGSDLSASFLRIGEGTHYFC